VSFGEDESLWTAASEGTYRWRERNSPAVSAPAALYFGNKEGSHYCTGFAFGPPPSDTATFESAALSFDASGTVSLQFSVFLSVRPQSEVDHLTVRLDRDDGTELIVWTKNDASEASSDTWISVSVDVSEHAPFSGALRVQFDVVDSVENGVNCYDGGTGVSLDDITLIRTCNQ
jgi:hypothetical protein